MQRLTKAVVTALFITGCVTGAVAREVFSVPPALAQTNIDRWDYYCIGENDIVTLQSKLKAAGQQGWELVTTSAVDGFKIAWCMKRRLPN